MLSLIRLIENLMTGRYATFWQIIFATVTLLFLWWFYESGNLEVTIQVIFSSFMFWLSLFNEVPETLKEGWKGGILESVFSLFWAAVFILLMFSIPLGLALVLFIFVFRPITTIRLLWTEAQEGVLWLIKLVIFFALIEIFGVIFSDEISFEPIMGLSILVIFFLGLDLITGGLVLEKAAYFLGLITAWVLRKLRGQPYGC